MLSVLFHDRGEGLVWDRREASEPHHANQKGRNMSHFIHTPQASYGGSAGLSNRQRWEIVIGVIVAVVVGFAAFAFVSNTNTHVVEPAAQPATQSYAAADDLATRSSATGAAAKNLVDTEAVAASDAGLFALAAEEAARQAEAGSGSIVPQSALDPFEMRAGSASGVAATPKGIASLRAAELPALYEAQSESEPAVGYFDGQWHTGYPTPEFR